MTQKPKMMQFLRKLHTMQERYIATVGIDVSARTDEEDGTIYINFSFISRKQTYTEEDGIQNPVVVSKSAYSFWSVAENKKVLDDFIKEVKKERSLILASSFKSCKN